MRQEQFLIILMQNQNLLFTILHFNDVYDIQKNKKGNFGVVNFQAFLRQQKEKYPKHIVLFSGDCFSPSILSNIFEGKHMVTCLNKLGIDVACYGNHEFDLQSNRTLSLAESCNFPWLLGNIKYKGTDFILGDGKPSLVKEFHGVKIGFFGIAGEDWLGILSEQYENQLTYQDVYKYSRKMCKYLKQQQKCDMIVALTHMRVYQDKRLPLQQPSIDIILGGHDHIIMKQFINGIPALKSGDNFKNLGVIHIYRKDKNPNAEYKGHTYDFDISIENIPEAHEDIDQELSKYVDACMQRYMKSDHIIGYTDTPLDTRFTQIRSKQTNYINFVTDLARSYFDVDCCILNSGSIRNDLLIPPGQLRYSVLSNLINNVLVVKEIPGDVMVELLEYSVAGLPGYSGCFLGVSGIRFTYDIKKTPRVQEVYIGNQPLKLDRIYTLVTQMYIAMGGDGFEMLKKCKMIVDAIAGIDTLRLILKFFKGLTTYETPQLIGPTQHIEHNNEDEQVIFPLQMVKLCRRISTKTTRILKFKKKFVMDDKGRKFVCISPTVDGRIKSIDS